VGTIQLCCYFPGIAGDDLGSEIDVCRPVSHDPAHVPVYPAGCRYMAKKRYDDAMPLFQAVAVGAKTRMHILGRIARKTTMTTAAAAAAAAAAA